MNPLSLITKGIQGLAGGIIIKKYYELPIKIEVDYPSIDLEVLVEQPIELIVEVD